VWKCCGVLFSVARLILEFFLYMVIKDKWSENILFNIWLHNYVQICQGGEKRSSFMTSLFAVIAHLPKVLPDKADQVSIDYSCTTHFDILKCFWFNCLLSFLWNFVFYHYLSFYHSFWHRNKLQLIFTKFVKIGLYRLNWTYICIGF